MNKYVKPEEFAIVIIAPAAQVKPALEKIGEVEVKPMPAARNPASRPSKEMLKPAA